MKEAYVSFAIAISAMLIGFVFLLIGCEDWNGNGIMPWQFCFSVTALCGFVLREALALFFSSLSSLSELTER
jgi:hypothetical protein